MKTTGYLQGISLNWKSHKPQITLEVDANAENIELLRDKKLSIELKQYKKKRSLEANAYYWTLCNEIAESMEQSSSWFHNYFLRKYGQIEMINDKPLYLVIPDTEEAEKMADESDTYHIKPTAEVKLGKDGKMYRTYIMLRGSHDYNTKEMSRLIDGVVSEAKEIGIETLTQDQIQEMMIAYEKHHAE